MGSPINNLGQIHDLRCSPPDGDYYEDEVPLWKRLNLKKPPSESPQETKPDIYDIPNLLKEGVDFLRKLLKGDYSTDTNIS